MTLAPNIASDSAHIDVNSLPSTYRALVYPFPWTAAESDFYDGFDPVGWEVFAQQTMRGGYDGNGGA